MYNCNECNYVSFPSADALRNHKRDNPIEEIFYGESLQSCKRVADMYTCPLCSMEYQATRAFLSHIKNKHNLQANYTKKRKVLYSEDNDNSSQEDDENKENIEFVTTSSSKLPLSTSASISEEDSAMTVSETILSSCDSLLKHKQEQEDKIMLAKVGRWMPLIFEVGNQQYGVLTSPTAANALISNQQQAGVWKLPTPDRYHCGTQINADISVEKLKEMSIASNALKDTKHVEMSKDICNLMNEDWLVRPNLRYCMSTLLAGAILVEHNTSIILNTVEPYGMDSTIDSHFESRSSNVNSSFPCVAGKYGYLKVCLQQTWHQTGHRNNDFQSFGDIKRSA